MALDIDEALLMYVSYDYDHDSDGDGNSYGYGDSDDEYYYLPREEESKEKAKFISTYENGFSIDGNIQTKEELQKMVRIKISINSKQSGIISLAFLLYHLFFTNLFICCPDHFLLNLC